MMATVNALRFLRSARRRRTFPSIGNAARPQTIGSRVADSSVRTSKTDKWAVTAASTLDAGSRYSSGCKRRAAGRHSGPTHRLYA